MSLRFLLLSIHCDVCVYKKNPPPAEAICNVDTSVCCLKGTRIQRIHTHTEFTANEREHTTDGVVWCQCVRYRFKQLEQLKTVLVYMLCDMLRMAQQNGHRTEWTMCMFAAQSYSHYTTYTSMHRERERDHRHMRSKYAHTFRSFFGRQCFSRSNASQPM